MVYSFGGNTNKECMVTRNTIQDNGGWGVVTNANGIIITNNNLAGNATGSIQSLGAGTVITDNIS